MPHSIGRLSASASSHHSLSSAAFITNIAESDFRHAQAQLETWQEDGSVDLAILYRTSGSPKNGDTYLVETSTYLVSAAGDPLTSRPTVRFSALHNLPLVLFCRPSSWRNHLEQISTERGISLNVVLEADSLSLQTQIVAGGGIYTLLGPYAIAAALKNVRLQSSR